MVDDSVGQSKKITVLFVDDDQQFLDVLQMRFYDLGYHALAANKPKDALEIARKFPLNLVVLDIGMPEMDGFRLLKALRQVIPDLPSVFLTGKKDKETLLKAFEMRSNCLVEKPCTPLELDFQIKRLLEGLRSKKV
jgi:CheY-like chemotaxis protein